MIVQHGEQNVNCRCLQLLYDCSTCSIRIHGDPRAAGVGGSAPHTGGPGTKADRDASPILGKGCALPGPAQSGPIKTTNVLLPGASCHRLRMPVKRTSLALRQVVGLGGPLENRLYHTRTKRTQAWCERPLGLGGLLASGTEPTRPPSAFLPVSLVDADLSDADSRLGSGRPLNCAGIAEHPVVSRMAHDG
jgi:hypothetical protein